MQHEDFDQAACPAGGGCFPLPVLPPCPPGKAGDCGAAGAWSASLGACLQAQLAWLLCARSQRFKEQFQTGFVKLSQEAAPAV